MALVNVSCGDSILVESILRENDQQKGFHAAKCWAGNGCCCRDWLWRRSGLGVLPFWLLVVGAIAVLGTPRPNFERH